MVCCSRFSVQRLGRGVFGLGSKTKLTVDRIGHLFCGECLTNSLAIENMKNKCPICRQKIDHKPHAKTPKGRPGKNNKGFYLLELKLQTVKKKGARKTIGGPSKR